MRIRPALLLLTACLPAGDPAQVGDNPPLQSLRADVIGCYEAVNMPTRDHGPVDLRPMLRVFELDSMPRLPQSALRRVHLSPTDVKRAYPSALPRGYMRLESVWSADSRTDSITVVARIEMSTLLARVDRSHDGSLRGYMRVLGEGAFTPEHAAEAAQQTWPDLVEWRRVPCRTLPLDRTYTIN